ncbi:hypothetical protein PAPYR_11467 [Paratrimastix pyriformis]|uniref:Uncharacterized protein n=1 Tax=Paratrimastix pyriformis TaxID=342808 RepID=A0ABQ8U7K0_9EUKA|nr:hypothetical protein PAPYR_11467 [Paratrimastix pyriformis]
MNSIDWNQFHTPKKPLSIARVRSARTPEMGRGLPGDQLPLGAGLMTPYHLELIRQTFDGLFRPSSPDSAGKDLLLDIGGEEDEPEREEPSSPAPAATHTAPGAPPAPTPTAPKAPTALTARPTTPASGAVEHKDKGTGAARPILDDDDVPSPPKPKKAAPAAAKPKKDREAPEEARRRPRWPPSPRRRPPRRRRPRPRPRHRPAGSLGRLMRPRRLRRRRARTTPPGGRQAAAPAQAPGPSGDLLLVVGRAPEPKAKAERKRARPTDPDDFSPEAARQVLQSVVDLVNAYLARHPPSLPPRSPSNAGLFDLSLSEKCHGKRAHVLLSSIDPCPSLARPLAYERLGAIVEWFEKLGAAVLFSIIVQTSALDEARYQVVDGSHRFQVARIIVDPRRGGEAQQATPQIRQHLKEDYIDVAVYNTLDPEAMLELQHRVNLLTHDARFGSSTFDVLLNLKRASLQRYIREDPDFATHLEPALKELHFPKGEDAPAKLVKILECFSLEMLCALPAPG